MMERFQNIVGCDSIHYLNLTINNSTSSKILSTSCNSYFWAENGESYYEDGIYIHIDTNINGCPHVDSLVLNISSVNSFITQIGDTLFAINDPQESSTSWYNIQKDDLDNKSNLVDGYKYIYILT